MPGRPKLTPVLSQRGLLLCPLSSPPRSGVWVTQLPSPALSPSQVGLPRDPSHTCSHLLGEHRKKTFPAALPKCPRLGWGWGLLISWGGQPQVACPPSPSPDLCLFPWVVGKSNKPSHRGGDGSGQICGDHGLQRPWLGEGLAHPESKSSCYT